MPPSSKNEKEERRVKRAYDNLDWYCERFMKHLRSKYKGRNAEISPWELTAEIKRFEKQFNMQPGSLIHAITVRQWLEPSAADTYLIRYDKVRK